MSPIFLLVVLLAAENIEASETCGKKLDVLLAVDTSTSICKSTEPCPEWYAILEFCKNIVDSLTVGYQESRVAFVTYSNETKVEWDLLRYTDGTSVKSAIDRVPYRGGELADLWAVISVAKVITEVYLPILKGNRLEVQNIGILITDGAPEYHDFVWQFMSTIIQADQVAVFVVCLRPGCKDSFAKGVASYPSKANETIFIVENPLLIDQVRDNLVKKFCVYKTLLPGLLEVIGK